MHILRVAVRTVTPFGIVLMVPLHTMMRALTSFVMKFQWYFLVEGRSYFNITGGMLDMIGI